MTAASGDGVAPLLGVKEWTEKILNARPDPAVLKLGAHHRFDAAASREIVTFLGGPNAPHTVSVIDAHFDDPTAAAGIVRAVRRSKQITAAELVGPCSVWWAALNSAINAGANSGEKRKNLDLTVQLRDYGPLRTYRHENAVWEWLYAVDQPHTFALTVPKLTLYQLPGRDFVKKGFVFKLNAIRLVAESIDVSAEAIGDAFRRLPRCRHAALSVGATHLTADADPVLIAPDTLAAATAALYRTVARASVEITMETASSDTKRVAAALAACFDAAVVQAVEQGGSHAASLSLTLQWGGENGECKSATGAAIRECVLGRRRREAARRKAQAAAAILKEAEDRAAAADRMWNDAATEGTKNVVVKVLQSSPKGADE